MLSCPHASRGLRCGGVLMRSITAYIYAQRSPLTTPDIALWPSSTPAISQCLVSLLVG